METYSGAAYLVMIGFLLRSNSPTPATSISRSYVYIRRSVVSKGSNQEVPVAPARTVPFGKRRNISIERRKRSLSPRLAASRKSEFSQTSAWLYGKQVNTLARRWCSSAWWVKYLGGEHEKKSLEKKSSVILIIGLAISLGALIGTNERFNGTIAGLTSQAANSNQLAAGAQLDAANARKEAAGLQKEAEDERLKRVEIEKSMEWRHLSQGAKKALCRILPPQNAEHETVVLTVWSDLEPAAYATKFRNTIGACKPLPGRPDLTQSPSLAMEPWSPPLRFGVWLEFPTAEQKMAKNLLSALRANGVDANLAPEKQNRFASSRNRLIVVEPMPYPNAEEQPTNIIAKTIP